MSDSNPQAMQSAFAWWLARLPRYNLILVSAAPVSFVCFGLISWLFEARLPCPEFSILHFAAGSLLFFMGLVAANFFYFLGPATEFLLRPRDAQFFRRCTYLLGVAFSLLMIFSPALLTLALATFAPSSNAQCS